MTSVFLVAFIFGFTITVAQLVLGSFGADAGHHDVQFEPNHADLDAHGEHGDTSKDALNLFSIRAISGGSLMFGCVGLSLVHTPDIVRLIAASVGGVIGTVVVAWAMRAMRNADQDGSLNYGIVKHKLARVYSGFGLKDDLGLETIGKVTVCIQGEELQLPAQNLSDKVLLPNQLVEIVGVTSDCLQVVAAPGSFTQYPLKENV